MRLRRLGSVWLVGALLASAPPAAAGPPPPGELRVEIHSPAAGTVVTDPLDAIDVEGGASIFGGVRYLDLILLIDTSKSLLKTDPKDYRVAGAAGLVRRLPVSRDLRIGVVDFDGDAHTVAPLTTDRGAVLAALGHLDRNGSTDIAAGLREALAGFERDARADATRVVLLFTDGESDEKDALLATAQARSQGVAVHTLLLGRNDDGAELLRAIAEGTGGSFLHVTDPARLPEAFANLRTTGIQRVVLSANGSPPAPAELAGGSFRGRVPLRLGENRIVATATSTDGRVADAEVALTVSGPLHVAIDSPLDGTLFAEKRSETAVEGSASLFAGLAPEQARSLSDHGVASVVLRVDDSPPFATTLEAGRFSGRVMLHEGENRIVATATSRDGRVADAEARVTVRPPGCGELEVQALRDGKPALSLSNRAVEVVFDASGSMWGRLGDRSKLDIAVGILQQALDDLPDDLQVALRVYGHQSAREKHDCRDSELLVPFAPEGRERVRRAISSFKPRGQTPLAYSIEQIASDFGGFQGERAVVLVTDGIESCGGDPVAAARALQGHGPLPVHVIGFGLADGADADTRSLAAIAEVSGGRYLAARSAEELRDALSVTVGAAYHVLRGGVAVAAGTLGAPERIVLPPGDYEVRVDSVPPYAAPVAVGDEERVTLVLDRSEAGVSPRVERGRGAYHTCEAAEVTARPTGPEGPPPAAPAP